MTKRDIAGLCCKLAGIFIITTSIMMLVMKLFFVSGDISNFLNLHHAGIDNQSTKMPLMELLADGGTAFGQLVLFGLGMWLWFDTGRFSAWIFPDENPDLPVAIDENFEPLLLSLMGIVILAMALPQFFTGVFVHDNSSFTIISSVINTGIGIWLCCRARNILKSTFDKGAE
jgi:hypothetical protein